MSAEQPNQATDFTFSATFMIGGRTNFVLMDNVKGKVIVITGASSGIGKETALLLAGLGAKVVLGARRVDRLQDISARITGAGGEALFRETNVSRQQDLRELTELAVQKFGRLDVLINNAGISHLSRLDEAFIAGSSSPGVPFIMI